MEKVKLPVQFRADWLKALRSGEYTQADDMLYDPDNKSYCCLGVACVVSGMSKDDITCGDIPGHLNPELLAQYEIPSVLQTGIRCTNDTDSDVTFVEQLVHMNDTKGCDFKEIADFIETNTEIE